MGKLWISTFITSMLGFCLNAQDVSLATQPLDSALAWLEKNIAANPEGFEEKARAVLQRAYQIGNIEQKAQAHENLATWFRYRGLFSYDSTIYHRTKSVQLLRQSTQPSRLADGYFLLAVDYLNLNKLDQAQETTFKAIAIYDSLNNELGLGRAYRRLAQIFETQGQFEQAIRYASQAVSILETAEDYYNLSLGWLTLTKAYTKSEQFEEAHAAADAGIEVVESLIPEEKGILMRLYGAKGNISEATRNYEQSLKDHTKAWEIAAAAFGAKNLGVESFREGIGRVLFLQGKYQEALPHLLAATAAYEEIETSLTPASWPLYRYISQCYEQLGDYKNALRFEQRSRTIYDTLMKGQIANLESEAVIKYETGKKDQALIEQAAIIRQKNRIQWMSIIAAIIFAVFALGLFYLYRKNQKTTKALATKNAENELLLKEIHHRVKNNLEMVSSLLKLQSVKTLDAEAKEVMKASQNRVQSMGIIHQKLYQGENLASIEMKDYFQNLSENILDAFDAHEQVVVQYQMDPLELDVDTAVPIGLIVNELLTNCLKYAFPEHRKGRIDLSLKPVNERQLQLEIADNGVGIAEDQGPKGTGFGSQLIKLLTMQLQGSMQTDFQNGSRFSFLLEKSNLN